MSLTAEQLAERTGYLGGSDAAAVLGLSRWKTPLEVWAEKVGVIAPKDLEDVLAVKLGKRLEDTVADLFTEETGKKVHRVNETIRHPIHPYIAANIDRRVVGTDEILECKTTSAWKAREWGGEEIPQEYIIQAMHYLAVTGRRKCHVAVLIGNQDFKIKEVVRDQVMIDDMIGREVAFWQGYVLPKIMPGIIKSGDSEVLFKLFPDHQEGATVVLDDEANQIIEILQAMKQDAFTLDKQIEQKENELKALLKDAEIGESALWRIRWKTQTTRRLDSTKFKSEMPELWNQFSEEKKSRVLRIARKGENNGND